MNEIFLKWKEIAGQEDGIHKIKEILFWRLGGVWNRLKYGSKFKKFGTATQIIKPDRMFGTKYVSLGKGVSILHHIRLEGISRYGGQKFEPLIEIGDNTSIGQNFHIVSNGELRIGKSVTISGNVFISTAAHDFRAVGVGVLEQKLTTDKVLIGDCSFIGYGAVIQPGVILGKRCIVGSNAVVLAGNYKDYSVLAGIPAKVVRRYDPNTGVWERTI